MVEKFKKISDIIVKEKGQVYLFAILKMDEYIDKWTVILSAEWASSEHRTEIFNYLRELILKELDREEVSRIARIGLFSKDTHLVRELSKYEKDYLISDTIKINGNIVHEGYIFSSNIPTGTAKSMP